MTHRNAPANGVIAITDHQTTHAGIVHSPCGGVSAPRKGSLYAHVQPSRQVGRGGAGADAGRMESRRQLHGVQGTHQYTRRPTLHRRNGLLRRRDPGGVAGSGACTAQHRCPRMGIGALESCYGPRRPRQETGGGAW